MLGEWSQKGNAAQLETFAGPPPRTCMQRSIEIVVVLPSASKKNPNITYSQSRHILIIPLATFSQLGTDVAMSLRIGECSKNGPVLTLPINRIPSKYRSDQVSAGESGCAGLWCTRSSTGFGKMYTAHSFRDAPREVFCPLYSTVVSCRARRAAPHRSGRDKTDNHLSPCADQAYREHALLVSRG